MAGKRRKTKSSRGFPGRGDLEVISLLLLGAAFFLAVSLYPAEPLSGEWGEMLRSRLLDYLGFLAYLAPLPLALAGVFLLFQRPLRILFRHSFFAALFGYALLPYCSFSCPDYAGLWGSFAAGWLQERLGSAGLLLPGLAAWVVLDLWLGKPPFWGLLKAVRAGLTSGGRLLASLFALRRRRLEHSDLRRAARQMLRQVEDLAGQYPDHAQLAGLANELRRIARRPSAEDEDVLAAYRETIAEFQKQRANELLQKLQLETSPIIADIEALARQLASPLDGGELLAELDSRRRALLLETAALKKQYLRLQRASSRDAERLRADHSRLAAVEAALLARRDDWRELHEAFEEVANRAEAWERWVSWAGSHPEDYHPAALQILKQGGLLAAPPDVVGESEPPEKPAPAATRQEPPAKPRQKPPRPQPAASPAGLPPAELLDPPEEARSNGAQLEAEAEERARVINETLSHFNLAARVVAWARGPSVTRFEVEPAPGEKISRIAGLANDIARALAVGSVRVEAPIPGKHVIGLEVPNAERQLVRFSEALFHPAYQRSKARLPLILGKSIDGEMWVRDLAGMPHLLIAGSTGSGKSVCVNTLVMSLLYRYQASELRFLMIDPKMVELTPYDGIPHLVRGVVTNPADAAGVLLGAVAHMERRYKMMSQVGARNLEQFNAKMRELGEPELPLLVIVIDELADLMITSPKEVEQAILRLAQMARATGMHLILATQRPSVDILTSLIKVNIPARIAFAVSSSHDSRTILDSTGAERLIGQGDMLFHQPGLAKPVRLQGPFLSDREIRRVTDFLREQEFEDAFGEAYGSDFDGPLAPGVNTGAVQGELPLDFSDPYLRRAAEIVVEEGQASVSRLQRRLSVGHARAGKLMDLLEAMGIVGPHQGSKPREVLITPDQLEEFFG